MGREVVFERVVLKWEVSVLELDWAELAIVALRVAVLELEGVARNALRWDWVVDSQG